LGFLGSVIPIIDSSSNSAWDVISSSLSADIAEASSTTSSTAFSIESTIGSPASLNALPKISSNAESKSSSTVAAVATIEGDADDDEPPESVENPTVRCHP